jgi:hypothetical protein
MSMLQWLLVTFLSFTFETVKEVHAFNLQGRQRSPPSKLLFSTLKIQGSGQRRQHKHTLFSTLKTQKGGNPPSIDIPFDALVSSTDPTPLSFYSWEDLLENHRTRTGKNLAEIPNFVKFCLNHRYHARRLEEVNEHPEEGFVPNLLHGGIKSGPIVRTQTPGQLLRALMAYPDGYLTAKPRHDLSSKYRHDDLDWVLQLQQHLPIIQEEVQRVLPTLPEDSAFDCLRNVRGTEWSDTTGWAHIAFVDNFRRQDQNIALFPQTLKTLDEIVGTKRRIGPRLVALAKQSAQSGIPEHCDFMNFMLTVHMTIQGPSQGCGIVVDGIKRDWIVGDPVVVDTTFKHHTYNDSDQDLYLLIVDFWHPDLSVDEIDALRHFFAVNSGV